MSKKEKIVEIYQSVGNFSVCQEELENAIKNKDYEKLTIINNLLKKSIKRLETRIDACFD